MSGISLSRAEASISQFASPRVGCTRPLGSRPSAAGRRAPPVPERTGRVAKSGICRIHQAIRQRPLLAPSVCPRCAKESPLKAQVEPFDKPRGNGAADGQSSDLAELDVRRLNWAEASDGRMVGMAAQLLLSTLSVSYTVASRATPRALLRAPVRVAVFLTISAPVAVDQ